MRRNTMISKLRLTTSQRGDTLVEVLIALAALSGLLGFSYALTTRAQKVSQLSQDRAEATQVAQSQLEMLRELRNSPSVGSIDKLVEAASGTIISPTQKTDGFCLDGSTTPLDATAADWAASQCVTGIGNRYQMRITYSGTPNRLFTARVEWVGPGDTGQQQVEIMYRLR